MPWEKKFECSPEIFIPECDYYPLDPAHSPWPLPGVARCDGIAMIYTSLLQLPDTSSGVLPLFPEDCPQTPHNPAVKRTKHTGTLRDAVVIPPSTQVLVQVEYNLRKLRISLSRLLSGTRVARWLKSLS